MDHAAGVGIGEGVAEQGDQAHRLVHRELALALEAGAEGLAFHVGHDVIEETSTRAVARVPRLSRVEQRQQVGVLQVGGDADLGQEAFGAEDGGELGAEDLEGHLAVVLEVVGEVDRRHAALAELALDAVAVGDQGLQPVNGVGQMGLSARDDRTRLKLASA